MRLILVFFYSLFTLLSSQAFASKLVVIQAISNSKKSFVTRIGRKDGVYPGTKGTFTGKNISLIAKASTVTREFTQWTVDNPKANIPFEKDEIITYHNTSEYLWTLMPENTRKKFVKELLVTTKNAFIVRTALATGLKQSVSGVDNISTERGGFLGEFIYEKELSNNFSFGMGVRIENETINVTSSSLQSTRQMGILEATYYMNKMPSFYEGRIFIGLSFGYGRSTTVSDAASQSGPVLLLPAVRLGLQLPMSDQYHFHFMAQLDSLSVEEGGDANVTQTTDSTNLVYGIGLRRYFF